MSETSILPGAEPPAAGGGGQVPPPADWDDEGGSGDDRRRLLIIGGIAVVLLVAVGGFLLLHKGGSSGPETFRPPGAVVPPTTSTTTPAPGTSPTAQPSGTPAPGKSAGSTKLPKKTRTVFARDPFKPLFVAPVSGGTDLGSANVGGGSGGFTFPSGGASGGAAPVQVPASDGPPLWIELIKTNGASDALFEVGYAHGKNFKFDVSAPAASSVQGTVFDNEFALLGIQGGDVTVQVGDATPFDLRAGVSHPV